MNAHETLAKVVDQEAKKLLKKSTDAKDAPLDAKDIEALEMLSRCVKALRAPVAGKAAIADDDGDDVPGLLKKAT